MEMKRRVPFVFSLTVMLFFLINSTARAQEKSYPAKPIQMIATVAAGTGVDIFFRLLSEELRKAWKVPINVLNKPAAGGVSACTDVANAEKDGYTMLATLMLTPISMTVANPKGPVNLLRDFDPIFVDVGYAAVIFVAKGDSEFRSLKDVVNYARTKPGELIFGAGKAGTMLYLEPELLRRETKINITVLPFEKGPVEIVPNVLGGHIHAGASSDTVAYAHIKAGRLRGLVTDIKSQILPDVPTFAEAGFPTIDLVPAVGLFGPKGLPPGVTKTWEKTLGALTKDPAFVDSVRKVNLNLDIWIGAEKLNKYLKGEIEKYSRFTPEELGWKR